MPDSTEDRLAALEQYTTSHEPLIQERWAQQWQRNRELDEASRRRAKYDQDHYDDHEVRLRVVERAQARLWGAVLLASFGGSGLGAALMLKAFG